MERNRRKKTVLLISNKVYHYRIPVYEQLNKRLQNIGCELVVLTNAIEAHASEDRQFELHVLPFNLFGYRKAIRQIEPDAVILFLHARDFIVWPLLLYLKIRGILVIYWNHGINLQTPDNRIKRAVFGIFHRLSDAIILYSVNEKKYIAEKYRDKLFVANNTIDFNSIPEIPESKEEIRERLKITFDKIVLFVGRITPAKRLDDLIAAAEYLEPGIGVVVVGEELTSEQAAKIEVSDKIRFLGGVYDPVSVNRIFKMADVFSIPGKVGLGVNQAFYWGLPIVTEKVRHSPEIVYVKDGVNGFIVDRHDARMLATKINELVSSETIYRKFSEAARAEILENASIDKMCDGFLAALQFLKMRDGDSAGIEDIAEQ